MVVFCDTVQLFHLPLRRDPKMADSKISRWMAGENNLLVDYDRFKTIQSS